jgi:hypothetical protein
VLVGGVLGVLASGAGVTMVGRSLASGALRAFGTLHEPGSGPL